MIGLILYLTGLLVAGSCGVMSAIADWKGMKIPNLYPGMVLGAFVVSFVGYAMATQDPEIFSSFTAHLTSAGIIFAITFFLFLTIRFGAGDSKLLTAFAIWFPPGLLIPFLFSMSVIGAALSLLAIIIRKVKPFKDPAEGSWIAKLQKGESVVPYGIAITGGAIVAFLSHGYISPTNLECFLQTCRL